MQEVVLNVSTRRKLAVHIIGTKTSAAGTSVAAVDDSSANGSVGGNNGVSLAAGAAAAAAARADQTNEAMTGAVGNGNTAEALHDGSTVQRPSASSAAEELAAPAAVATESRASEQEAPNSEASSDADPAALDVATTAADVLGVEGIWDFKRRQATWHSSS